MNVYDANHYSGHVATVDVNYIDGNNDLRVFCYDLFGRFETDYQNFTVKQYFFRLVDEPTGNIPFDLNLMDDARFYVPATQEEINLKDANQTDIYYTTDTANRVRFEFTYDNAGDPIIITRDFNVILLEDFNTIGVCANELTDFYEQLFVSAQIRPVTLKNIFADCYVLADYTDIVYSDNFTNTAFTIGMFYELTTEVDQASFILGNLDGSHATITNIDVLLLKLNPYNIGQNNEDVGIQLFDENTIKIYYYNPDKDNVQVNFKIYDGSTQLYDYTELSTPNEVTILWDFSAITFDNNMLKLVVTSEGDSGTYTITRYFTTKGETGILDPVLAIFIGLILVIFAFTFVVSRAALGWFGIVATLIALGITSLATPVWYLTFFQVILVIALLFLFLVLKEESLGVQ